MEMKGYPIVIKYTVFVNNMISSDTTGVSTYHTVTEKTNIKYFVDHHTDI